MYIGYQYSRRYKRSRELEAFILLPWPWTVASLILAEFLEMREPSSYKEASNAYCNVLLGPPDSAEMAKVGVSWEEIPRRSS
jgi:hypothetical protein